MILHLFVCFAQSSFPYFLFLQVDELSVFRHRGERKVKTVEEDMDEVTSTTSDLLNEEGEELMGKLPQKDG